MDASADARPDRITGRRTVDPDRLPGAERDALCHRLYAIHRRIFSGTIEAEFRAHVIDPPAELSRIQLYQGPGGDDAGYCAVHRYRRRVAGRDVIVIRAEAGLRPEYRGRGTTYWFGMVCALANKLRHPFTPVYYLGTLVHPSSYHLFWKYFPRVFPYPDGRFAASMRALALELVEGFPDEAVSADDPMIRDVGWITIDSPQEVVLAHRPDLPDVWFFKTRNPGYRQGHGLVVLVPITFRNVLAALARRLAEVAGLAVMRREPSL